MDQKQINDNEWKCKDNWSGGALGLYFSKRDSRTWVPKSIPAFGWTLNVGKPAGARWLFLLLLAPFFITLAMLIILK